MKKTKYLGIYHDEHRTWNFQLNQIKTKLSRSWGLLAKLRYYVKTELLRTVYFAIFGSVLRYAGQVWGQHRNQEIKEIEKRHEKAIRIMSFKGRNDLANPLFKTLEITKLNPILVGRGVKKPNKNRVKDILLYNNCVFAHNQINENLPEKFKDFFQTAANQHNYNIRGTTNKNIIKTTINSTTYGLNSIKNRPASDWNQISKNLNTEGNIHLTPTTKLSNRNKVII